MSTATVEIPIHHNVTTFVGAPRKMLIGGRWLEAASGKTFPTYNPATGEVLAQVAEGNSADVDSAVTAARKAFESGPWRTLTASERGRLIWKLADLLESHLEEFAQLESLDNGKPIGVARAADVPLAVDHFRYMAGWATKIEGNTIPISVPYTPGARYLSYTLREPVGVVGPDHPMEFPAAYGGLETRTSVGRRLHHRPEACRADTAVRLTTRRADLRSGIPGRGNQHCDRVRGDRRRGAGGAPGRGQGGLYWLHRSGKAHSEGSGRESQGSIAGARREVPQHRVHRRRSGGEHTWSRERDLF